MNTFHDIILTISICVTFCLVGACVISLCKAKRKATRRASHYFDSLQKVLGKPYEQFVLSEKDRDFLIEHNYSPEALYHLVVLIMLHLKMPYTKIQVNVRDGTGLKTAGQYSLQSGSATIDIQVKPYFTGDQVIAIVCHECAHHFLQVKRIRGKNPETNELLTDYATIFTGFGDLMEKGYAEVNNIINGKNTLTKVGYISIYDIHVAIKLLPNYLR